MDFEYSDRTRELQARVTAFMEAHIYPNEVTYHCLLYTSDAADE